VDDVIEKNIAVNLVQLGNCSVWENLSHGLAFWQSTREKGLLKCIPKACLVYPEVYQLQRHDSYLTGFVQLSHFHILCRLAH